jgi:glycosyltransferase involved in cell wall biosynthesis
MIMRIAQIAPLAEAVPPKLYGGTERIVCFLTEALIDLGHEVTLFASGDSKTRASLVPIVPQAFRLSRKAIDYAAACAVLLQKAADSAASFDIIHCHLDWLHLPVFDRLATPVLTTLHGRLDFPIIREIVTLFPDAPFVSISGDQRRPIPDVNWLATIHHGLPANLFRPVAEPEGYLAFLGRISPEKGPDVAIRLARASNRALRIAAKVPRSGQKYFQQQIAPLLEGGDVQFLGEIGGQRKAEFLGKASALLFPINWPEPFGLVLIEAMACGTPCIAFRSGAVSEIIEDGVTGFVVDTEEEALGAIGRIHQIDRAGVRRRFEQRFTAKRMAQDYVRAYEKLAGHRLRLPLVPSVSV